MSHWSDTVDLYQNDPEITIGRYVRLLEDAEARDIDEQFEQLVEELRDEFGWAD